MYTHLDEIDSNKKLLYIDKEDAGINGIIEEKKYDLIENLEENKGLDTDKTE